MSTQFFAQVKLETSAEKGSYGIGLQIGQQLLDTGFAVSAEAVAKGIYDVLISVYKLVSSCWIQVLRLALKR